MTEHSTDFSLMQNCTAAVKPCFSNFHFLLKREHINETFLYGETMCEMCNVYT